MAVRLRTQGVLLSAFLRDPSGHGIAATASRLDRGFGGVLFSRQQGEHSLFVFPVPGQVVFEPQPYEVIVSPVDTLPEDGPSRLEPGAVRASELHADGDVDIYGVALPPGSLVSVFAHSLGSGLSWLTTEVARVSDHDPIPLGGNTPLGSYTAPIDAPSGDSLRIVVQGWSGGFEVGREAPYRLEVYPIDRGPEVVSALLVPGVEVADEALERPVDVDEFVWAARADRQYLLMLNESESLGPVIVTALWGHQALARVPNGFDGLPSGFFGAGGTGDRSVRVEAPHAGDLFDVPYRFTLYEVDPAPETAPAALPLGAWLTSEAVTTADIDEFDLVVSDRVWATLVVQKLSADPTGDLSVLASRVGQPLDWILVSGMSEDMFPLLELEPGTYPLRIASAAGYVGPYALLTSTYEPGPEDAPATLYVGDRITESVQPLADGDAYTVRPSFPRQYFDLVVTGRGREGGDPLVLLLHYVAGWPLGAHVPAHAETTIPVRITGAEPIELLVTTHRMGPQWSDTGSYELALVETPVALESAAGRELSPLDSVLGERVDSYGDIDRLHLSGAPGEPVVLGARASGAGSVRLVTFDPDDGRTLDQVEAAGMRRLVGPIAVPAGGRIGVEVEDECFPACNAGMQYEIFSYPFNPAPETATANLTLGDTVVESIDLPGDVDEFRLSVEAGKNVRVALARTGPGSDSAAIIWVQALDPSGQTLQTMGRGSTASDGFGDFMFLSLPAPGSYTFRVYMGSDQPVDVSGYLLLLREY